MTGYIGGTTPMPDDVSSRILAAATLAEQAAKGPPSYVGWTKGNTAISCPGFDEASQRLIVASGPSHWGAVARMLRGAESVGFEIPELIDLADQIIRDLGIRS